MLSRDSGLPADTRNTLGISVNVSESFPAREVLADWDRLLQDIF